MISLDAIISARVIFKYKQYAFLNFVGLTVALSSAFFIFIFVIHELSYERFFENSESVYRISQNINFPDGTPPLYLAPASPQVATLLPFEFPQINTIARVRNFEATISYINQSYLQEVSFVDRDLFEIFDFEWIEGDVQSALSLANTAVLDKSTSTLLFGEESPIGNTIVIENEHPMLVVGLIEDLPTTTHLDLGILVSMQSIESILGSGVLENWSIQSYHTYALIGDDSVGRNITARSPEFFDKYAGEGSGEYFSLSVEPITTIHLESTRTNEMKELGSIVIVEALILVAILILGLASANFINLTTAMSNRRALEIGIKKAFGASQMGIALRFFKESFALISLSAMVAILITYITISEFNSFIGANISTDVPSLIVYFGLVGLLTVILTIVSGCYPSYYISAFSTAEALKGETIGKSSSRLRTLLVTSQFAIAIVLLICTMTIFRQISFMASIGLGLRTENVIALAGSPRTGLGENWEAFKNEVLAIPGVSMITGSSIVPGEQISTSYFVLAEDSSDRRSMPTISVDFGFFELYEISFLSGRPFSRDVTTDRTIRPTEGSSAGSSAYIINEIAADQLGWPADQAIGKRMEITCCGYGPGTVIGVVNDPLFEPLQNIAGPIAFVIPPGIDDPSVTRAPPQIRKASIALEVPANPQIFQSLSSIWDRFNPGQPINIVNIEQNMRNLYQNQEKQAILFLYFTGQAILIAYLGLFGLTAFITESCKQDIAIRKVLGGSVIDIAMLYIKDFSKLIMASFAIAWPISYILSQRWLSSFAYRINPEIWIYTLGSILILILAVVTVGSISLKAAATNPSEVLRNE